MKKRTSKIFAVVLVLSLVFSLFVHLPVISLGYSNKTNSNILFSDNFSNGLGMWMLFGDPEPVIDYNAGNPAPSFNNNGDPDYNSGAYTCEEFNPAGTVLEGDIYIAAHSDGCWTDCSIGFAKSDTGYSDTSWAGYAVGIGYRYEGDACWATPSQYREHGVLDCWLVTDDGSNKGKTFWTDDAYLNGWHHYKIVITPDRYVKFYVDGTLVYAPSYRLGSQFAEEPILLGKRSYYGDSLIDNIKLSTLSSSNFNCSIWIDKGCGATYSDNEAIDVYFKSDKAGSAYILDYETSGSTKQFGPWDISAGHTYKISGTVSGPAGTETLELHVNATDGTSSKSSCIFYIENTTPQNVNVKLWLDKGCGATYCVGDKPRAYFEVDQDIPISMFEYMPDGTVKTIIDHQQCEANVQYEVDGKASYPLGKRTLKVVAYCSCGSEGAPPVIQKFKPAHLLTVIPSTKKEVKENRSVNANCSSYAVPLSINDSGETICGSATCSFIVEDCKAQLNLEKDVDKTTAKVGDILTYTITYSNQGNYKASNIKVTDAIPYGTTYVGGSAEFLDTPSSTHSISFSHNNGSSYDNSDSYSVTNIKWEAASLSSNDSIRLRFKVKVTKDDTFTVRNTANLIADGLNSPITDSATTEVTKMEPPSSPSLTATAEDSKVILEWGTPSEGTYSIAGYKIYKGTYSGGESNTPIATVGYGTNSYIDTNVVNSTTYYYYIKAFDNQSPANYSEPSNEVSATPKSVAPPPDKTNNNDSDGDGKKDLSAGTSNSWVEVKTTETSSVISGAGVQSGKKEVIKNVSTNKHFGDLTLISTSSVHVLRNDSDYLVYEVDKFYEGSGGKSATVRWTTIIPKNEDYWIFLAQVENTGYSAINISDNPNLLNTEIVSPERLIVSGVSENDVSNLYTGEAFRPNKSETLMIEYNSDTVAAMGYMAPWTTAVDKFTVGDNKGINTVVNGSIVEPDNVGLWQGMLVVDTTSHVLSYLPDKPLLQSINKNVSPEVMDRYVLGGVKKIFKKAQDNELSIFASVGNAITGFNDLGSTIASGAMVLLSKFGIIKGYGDGTVKPNKPVSRAEFSTMIVNTMKFEHQTPPHPDFKDVSPGNWYYQYVETAYENGIVHGYPDGTFKPNNTITKAESVTVVDNLLHLTYYGYEKTFVDVTKSFWGYKYIEAAYNKSVIVLQYPIVEPAGPYFKPNYPTMRNVAAIFISQGMKYRNLNE